MGGRNNNCFTICNLFSSFYELKLFPEGKSKQPCYDFANAGGPLFFAGIWETTTIDERVFYSCTIITADSNS
ncbi:SOS response-associated peptidase family protein [Nitrosomonas communis]|uniref:SOS response-associated peptidase family protein n=1 Tax=Nitrosomonas communis TaxID=44574 RepID=UPI000942F022